jgi:Na+/alanine symporter
MQDAMQESFGGTFGNCLLSVLIAIFVFTTLMAYYYQAEANLRYLSKGSKAATRVFQVVYLFANFLGVLVNGQVIWSMGDTGAGLMAWANLIGIVILSPVFFKILKDFDKQKKAGLDPLYDPATVGLEDSDGIWTAYVDKKKARGDYENPVLGYDKIVKK